MKWIKNIVVDIAASALVAVTVFSDYEWAYWILAAYTGFMVLIKLVGLLGPPVKTRVSEETPPDWVYHVLYAFNTVLLAWCQCWLLAGGWLLIWILSIAYKRKKG